MCDVEWYSIRERAMTVKINVHDEYAEKHYITQKFCSSSYGISL